MGRIGIFIDGAYLEHTMREWFDYARVDFQQLARWLASPHELLRVHYYHCLPYLTPEPTPEQRERYERKRSFFMALEHIPRFSVRLGQLQAHQGDDGATITHQKQVDVHLSVDVVLLATRRAITDAVLVAGDGDFVPAVEAAQGEGVVVHLVHGPRYSDLLWQTADERTELLPEHIRRFRLEGSEQVTPAAEATGDAVEARSEPDEEAADGARTVMGPFERRLVNGVIRSDDGDTVFVPEGIVRGLGIRHGDLVLATEEGRLPNGRPRYYYTVVEQGAREELKHRREVAGILERSQKAEEAAGEYFVPDGPRKVYVPPGDLKRWNVAPGDLVTVAFDPQTFSNGASWTHGRVVERHQLDAAAPDDA